MPEPSRDQGAARWAGPALLVVLFGALCAWSWRKWTDVHIDFGNELYIAWRLSEGDALYRDIAHRNGPLSHYWNALLFSLFGASLRTLVLANLALLAGICALVWRIFARTCDRFTATTAVAVLLGAFAFGQYAGIANYNYVTPYHHFQTHGLLLSLAMLLALDGGLRGGAGAGRRFLLAGVLLGAVFLTKAELFLPSLAAAAASFVLRFTGLAGGDRSGAAGELLACALGALLPVVGFALLLATQMPLGQALFGVAGNWAHLADSAADPFYRSGAGLDDPLGNAARAGLALLALAAFAGAAAGLDRLGRRLERPQRVAAALGAALLLVLLLGSSRLPWPHLARALPLTSLAAVVWLARDVRARGDGAHAEGRCLALLFAVYATALLAKLGLAARFHQYGFALAMPATLLLVAAGVYTLPGWLRERHGGGSIARALCLALTLGGVVFLLGVSQRHYARKHLEVGRGADAMLAKGPESTPRPQRIQQTLRDLEARLQPGDTLLVLPEGVGLNYWLRRENPTPFNLFLPTEIQAFGEAALLAALRQRPPDFVVLLHRPHAEFGVGPFGQDPRNGRALLRFVNEHYRRVQGFGPEPFTGRGFGTRVLERLDRAGRQGPAPPASLR